MNGTPGWMMIATVLLVACGDKPARPVAEPPSVGPVVPPTPADPVALPPAVSRAALEDAGVVTVTANELFDAGDGGVVDDVRRAAQGAGYGEVEFAIKRSAPDAAVPAPPAPPPVP